MKNYYETLGLSSNATEQEIKDAYRKLSKKFHPDANNGDKFFEERFKEIQIAYEQLKDENYRKSFAEFQRPKTKPIAPQVQRTPPVTTIKKQNSNQGIALMLIIGAIFWSIYYSSANNQEEAPVTENVESPPLYDVQPVAEENINLSLDTTKTKDFKITPSKEETEKWIIEKLSSYTPETYFLKSDYNSSYGEHYIPPMIYRQNYKYSFDKFNLNINYEIKVVKGEVTEIEENFVQIPIYDILDVSYNKGDLYIQTKNNTIAQTNLKTGIKRMEILFATDFKIDQETDMIVRLKKAVLHLQNFYDKPLNTQAF